MQTPQIGSATQEAAQLNRNRSTPTAGAAATSGRFAASSALSCHKLLGKPLGKPLGEPLRARRRLAQTRSAGRADPMPPFRAGRYRGPSVSLASMAARVIILNGPSASGKSSIQKALQAKLAEPFLAMGLDSMFCAMLPQRYFTGQQPDERDVCWGESSLDSDGSPVFTLRLGPKGRRIFLGMHGAIAAFARAGCSVIVDYILYMPDLLPELVAALDGIQAYFVGVRIPLAVLEDREKARATSPLGHARSHYTTVHAHGGYDLEVDTSTMTPDACAAAIIEHINSVAPVAFSRLAKARASRSTAPPSR